MPENEISLYRGELTPRCLVECSAKVQKAFPALTPGFFEVFSEAVRNNGFSNDRLKDAVSHVIENCVYPAPTIAQFISWDKRIKVLTYEEMLKKTDELGGDKTAGRIFESEYKPIKFANRVKAVWVHVNDIKMYNITSET
jgi:hypothetical protein